MQSVGLYVGERGKGRACWLAIGYLLAEERVEYIAFQDADVVNFKREMLARLVLPTLDPTVDFDFVKGYYARVSDRLHGRVTRLLLTPLLAAFTRLIGDDPYIRYLSSFRYALSGEFAMKSDLAAAHAPALRLGPRDRDAVRGAAAPRPRARLPGRADRPLRPQAPGALGRGPDDRPPPHGARRGEAPASHARRGRRATCTTASCAACWPPTSARPRTRSPTATRWPPSTGSSSTGTRRSRTCSVFTRALRSSIEEFLADPLGAPLVPNWARVWAGVPDAGQRLMAAVKEGQGDLSLARAAV